METRSIRVLLIEDNGGDAVLYRGMLLAAARPPVSFLVETAASFRDAVELLESARFDAVVLDLETEGSRFLDAFEKIRHKAMELPVVLLAGTRDENLELEALSRGAQSCLTKGKVEAELLSRVLLFAIERVQLLQRLSETSEKRFRNLIENSAEGMVVASRQGLVRFVNPAAEKIFEKDANDFVGKLFDYPLLPGSPAELEIRTEDGQGKVAEMQVVEIEWGGQPAYLATVRDVTALKRMDQLKTEIVERRRIEQMKDEFISTVSHELRTPLTIMKVALDNLRDGVAGPVNEKQARILEMADGNASRLTGLLNDILDLSRLESGKAKVHRSESGMSELLEKSLENYRLLAQERPLVLESGIPSGLPALRVDPDMIQQVMSNLLSNAFRYARGKVRVSAQAVECSFGKEGGTFQGVQVSVADDGPGIARGKIDQLFNKFVQINRPSGGTGYKGTGLGLAICKEILKLHHGRIWVESEEGKNCVFHFLLPQYDEKTDFWLALWTALNEAEAAKAPLAVVAVTFADMEGLRRQAGEGEAAAWLHDLSEKIRLRVLRRLDMIQTFRDFVVIFAQTNVPGGLAIRRRILESFKDRVVTPREGGRSLTLRPVAGASSFPDDGRDPQTLFALASRRALDGGGDA